MANIGLEIIQVQDSGNVLMEADEVRFKVVSGTPTEEEISKLLSKNAKAISNLSYCENDKSGLFIDLNFEFHKGKIIRFESTSS